MNTSDEPLPKRSRRNAIRPNSSEADVLREFAMNHLINSMTINNDEIIQNEVDSSLNNDPSNQNENQEETVETILESIVVDIIQNGIDNNNGELEEKCNSDQ